MWWRIELEKKEKCATKVLISIVWSLCKWIDQLCDIVKTDDYYNKPYLLCWKSAHYAKYTNIYLGGGGFGGMACSGYFLLKQTTPRPFYFN